MKALEVQIAWEYIQLVHVLRASPYAALID